MRARVIEWIVVGLIAVFAIAGLVVANRPMECLFFSFTLITILTAAMLVIAKVGESRVFWATFAAVSCAYLVFAHQVDEYDSSPRHAGPEITTQLLRLAYNRLHEDVFLSYFSFSDDESASPLPVDPFSGDPFGGNATSFMRIGHSAWALLLGWIAGYVAVFVYRREHRPLT